MGVEIRRQPNPTEVRDFKLEIVELSRLKSHEMTIPAGLDNFKVNVVKDGMVKHPIIVDKDSFLILDGHHRKTGLMELGYKNAPAILLDYSDDDLVSLDTWYPRLKVHPKEFVEQLNSQGLVTTEFKGDLPMNKLKQREITAVIGNKEKLWTVTGDRETIFEMVRNNWLNEVIYYDIIDDCLKETAINETSIIAWSYSKQEVIEHAKQGNVYLPKTTRHHVKYLYPNCNYPLDKLEKQ